MSCGSTYAFTLGEEAPPIAVVYEPDDESSSACFTVVFSDAPPPDNCDDDDELGDDEKVICAHCLINEYPEVGRGLDFAKQLGDAEGCLVVVERDLDTGEWRLSPDGGEAIAEEARRRRRLGIPIA